MKRLLAVLNPTSLYRLAPFRYLVVLTRLKVLLKTRGLRQFAGHDSLPVTIDHNLRSLSRFNVRNEKLFYACLHIENIEKARTLIIGCRNEEEIFLFKGFGFDDVSAMDLISYSPHVELGDMHAIDRPDDSVDFLYCAYTIAYSKSPAEAAAEFVRVVRDGGTIAIAVEYAPHEERSDIQRSLLGYDIAPDRSIATADALLDLFGENVGEVHVKYDAVQKKYHTATGLIPDPSPVIVVFSVSKSAEAAIAA